MDDIKQLAEQIQNRAINEKELWFIDKIAPKLNNAIAVLEKNPADDQALSERYCLSGLFHLLLGRPYDSLSAYTRAMGMKQSKAHINEALETITSMINACRLQIAGTHLLQFETIERFLLIAAYTNNPQSGVLFEQLKTQSLHPYSKIQSPIIITAGGCDSLVEKKIQGYSHLFEAAFGQYKGIIISGGTDSGISKLTGDLTSTDITKIAYLPRAIPDSCQRHSAFKVIQTQGNGFSAFEPAQIWTDLLASHIDPSEIKLLGINGGNISSVEYRFALFIGAKVGIIKNTGRAADQLINDTAWNQKTNLFILSDDEQAIKEFVFSD